MRNSRAVREEQSGLGPDSPGHDGYVIESRATRTPTWQIVGASNARAAISARIRCCR